jgi:hypothetical protein
MSVSAVTSTISSRSARYLENRVLIVIWHLMLQDYLIRDSGNLCAICQSPLRNRARTVAVVVGVEGDEDDLDHGEEDEAVDDDGEDAEDVVRVADPVLEGVGVHVQRRRAEVGVQDPHALECQP